MTDFRILDYNYCFEDATRLLASSSDASFPVSNLSHVLRTKVWRSSGYFEITSSNNKMDFKDDAAGSELTASIPEGTYSPQELASQIGSSMTLASLASEVDTITCTYGAGTGRWTIETDGAFLSLLFSSGTNTAETIGGAIGFDDSSDSTGAVSYSGPVIAIHTEERVTIDLVNTQEIDSMAVVFHPFEGAKFTSSAVIKLQADAHPDWSSPAVDVTLSYDDRYNEITHFFSAAQSYRYWSIQIVDPSNPNLYVELPKVMLAKATQLTQLPNLGFKEARTDFSARTVTPYGQPYTDLNPTRRQVSFPYEVLSADDLTALLDVFERVGTGVPIGVALDSQASVFDKDRFFIYGTIVESIETDHVFYDLFNTGFTIEETL